jgi:hypothetical protein
MSPGKLPRSAVRAPDAPPAGVVAVVLLGVLAVVGVLVLGVLGVADFDLELELDPQAAIANAASTAIIIATALRGRTPS